MLSLSPVRKKRLSNSPSRHYLRRDRIFLTGQDRKETHHIHQVKLTQRRRDYQRLLENDKRQRSSADLIELVCPPVRGLRVRPVINGINYPAPGEDWNSLNQWRASFGLNPVNPDRGN